MRDSGVVFFHHISCERIERNENDPCKKKKGRGEERSKDMKERMEEGRKRGNPNGMWKRGSWNGWEESNITQVEKFKDRKKGCFLEHISTATRGFWANNTSTRNGSTSIYLYAYIYTCIYVYVWPLADYLQMAQSVICVWKKKEPRYRNVCSFRSQNEAKE